MSGRRNPLLIVGTILVLAAAWSASAGLQVVIDVEKTAYQDTPETLWIGSGKVLKALSLGHEGLLADVYWTRVVQYYGSRLRDRKTDFSLLAPLLNITVTLDPHLLLAYPFGSFFLSQPAPRGAGQPAQAVALLQYGIQNNPQEWRLWHYLGFLYYWELQDYPKAVAAYQEGAKNPKALPFMKVMAATILEKGGSRETSRFLWSEIYRTVQDPTIRANALSHLQGMKANQDIEELERLARQFHDQTGSWPASMRDLVTRGLLAGLPVDPTGFPYRMGPEGKVHLDSESTVHLEYDRAPSPQPVAQP
jgi:tetratricopeptide (TPR) repeat protein